MVIPSLWTPLDGGYRIETPVDAAPSAALTMVLLPGIEGDGRVFHRLTPLTQFGEVLVLDVPGGHHTLESVAAALLTRIAPSQFVVFGSSLGGLIGWTMSVLAPGRVKGLMVHGTLPDPKWIPPHMMRLQPLIRRIPDPFFRRLYGRHLRQQMRSEGIAEEDCRWLTERLPGAADLSARLTMLKQWHAQPPPVPTRWLWSADDREVRWHASDIHDLLPEVELVTITGGHRVHLTNPEMVMETMCGFLQRVG